MKIKKDIQSNELLKFTAKPHEEGLTYSTLSITCS